MKRPWLLLTLALLPLSVTLGADHSTATSTTAPRPEANKITAGQAAVLGVVEGLTEYLPVSSTGHLILAGHLMGLVEIDAKQAGLIGPMIVKNPAIDSFDIVIQFGAILAVVGLYRRRVGQMAGGLVGRSPEGLRLLQLLFIAFSPAAVFGRAFHRRIEENLFGPVPVLLALAVGGVLMIAVEHFFWRVPQKRQALGQPTPPRIGIDQMTYAQALVVGLAQVAALWPGTSRSMITILAGLVVGLDMVAAAEFSFLLALPTLTAATVYSGAKHWHELRESAGLLELLIGIVVSGVVAAIAVKAFVKWLTRHGMIPFGIYRIALAIVYARMVLWPT